MEIHPVRKKERFYEKESGLVGCSGQTGARNRVILSFLIPESDLFGEAFQGKDPFQPLDRLWLFFVPG